MTLLGVALAWAGVSMLSGLFLGNLLHTGRGLTSAWDPAGTLDGTAVTPDEPHVAPRHHHTSR
jgi:hypothetical protein